MSEDDCLCGQDSVECPVHPPEYYPEDLPPDPAWTTEPASPRPSQAHATPRCPGCEQTSCVCPPVAPPARAPREVARELLMQALHDSNLAASARQLPGAMDDALAFILGGPGPGGAVASTVLVFALALPRTTTSDGMFRILAQVAIEALHREARDPVVATLDADARLLLRLELLAEDLEVVGPMRERVLDLARRMGSPR